MRYFTSDTHFGHPLVTALRGFLNNGRLRTEYRDVWQAQGRAGVHGRRAVQTAALSGPAAAAQPDWAGCRQDVCERINALSRGFPILKPKRRPL